MSEGQETGHFQRIEADARDVLPLPRMLLFLSLMFCPVWISAATAAAAELSSSSLPDKFYGAVNMMLGGYGIATAAAALFLAKRADKRQTGLARKTRELSSFQLGLGAVMVALGGWRYRVPVILLVIFFLAVKLTGEDHAELTEAARFWYAQEFFAYVAGFIFCFLGFCLWFGHRVQKQRAAG